jgi:serine/threonine protein phosphatase PrpC
MVVVPVTALSVPRGRTVRASGRWAVLVAIVGAGLWMATPAGAAQGATGSTTDLPLCPFATSVVDQAPVEIGDRPQDTSDPFTVLLATEGAEPPRALTLTRVAVVPDDGALSARLVGGETDGEHSEIQLQRTSTGQLPPQVELVVVSKHDGPAIGCGLTVAVARAGTGGSRHLLPIAVGLGAAVGLVGLVIWAVGPRGSAGPTKRRPSGDAPDRGGETTTDRRPRELAGRPTGMSRRASEPPGHLAAGSAGRMTSTGSLSSASASPDVVSPIGSSAPVAPAAPPLVASGPRAGGSQSARAPLRQARPPRRQGQATDLPAEGRWTALDPPEPPGTASADAGWRARLELIAPRVRDTTTVWAREGARQLVAVYTEKRAAAGEDAPPSIVVGDGGALVAVYDGLGGAGAQAACLNDHGEPVSQAHLASRLVRRTLERWYVDRCQRGASLDGDDLAEEVLDDLSEAARDLLPETTAVRGMQRTLPTTMAAVAVGPVDGRPVTNPAGPWLLRALWAGDSRAYVLRPASGLQQLTLDHVRRFDVLQQLVNDSPMSNVISASAPFTIQRREASLEGPLVALCATDGVFGYVRTPGETEAVLLSTLVEARDATDWAWRLAQRISAYTGDDATLALTAVGWRDFAALRSAFAARADVVAREQHAPFEQDGAGDDGRQGGQGGQGGQGRDGHDDLRGIAWERYRGDYEELLRPSVQDPS